MRSKREGKFYVQTNACLKNIEWAQIYEVKIIHPAVHWAEGTFRISNTVSFQKQSVYASVFYNTNR